MKKIKQARAESLDIQMYTHLNENDMHLHCKANDIMVVLRYRFFKGSQSALQVHVMFSLVEVFTVRLLVTTLPTVTSGMSSIWGLMQ